MSNLRWLGLLAAVAVLAAVTLGGLFVFGRLTSHAVQNPTMSLDMIPSDNTYDESTNTMSVVYNPTTDFCLASAVANAATHTHAAHLIIQNVVDLVGWQARLNYVGDQMRPSTQNATPFTDNTTSQNIGFTNLPIDQGTLLHRDVTTGAAIPPAAPGPQTALIGATYNGTPTTSISPDTPAKAVPDDTSYSAPTGGILTQINLQVVGNHSGQTLYIDLSDDVPNPPGSNVVYFDGTGTATIALAEGSLGDAVHVEGGTCPAPTPSPSPTATAEPPTATASPTPTPPPPPTPRPCSPTPSPEQSPTSTPTATAAVPGSTRRVSVNDCGEQGDGPSEGSTLSGDGRLIAFTSLATNLVAPDTNQGGDAFVYDQFSRTIQRVSIASDGAQANGGISAAAISADGRFVAFASVASNLVPNDNNIFADIFVHDLTTGLTEMVSVNSQGAHGNEGGGQPIISGDGRFIAFLSRSSNLTSDGNPYNLIHVYVHDRLTGTTEKVDVDNQGNEGNDYTLQPAISGDGRFVAFASFATNLGAGGDHQRAQVFLRDRMTGTTEVIGISSSGVLGNGGHAYPSVSAGGRFVSFGSSSSNLVDNDTNGVADIFVRDRVAQSTERASVGAFGNQANQASLRSAVSAGGRFVAFDSLASNLSADTNNTDDVFLRDRLAQQTERVSLGNSGNEGNGSSIRPAVSDDGRFVSFDSLANNLVDGDSNTSSDVFVRDRFFAPSPTPTATPSTTPTATATSPPTPSATPTSSAAPTPAPTLTGNHDARLKKISASSSVVLSDGTADIKNIVTQVRNEGDHTESIGVYVDMLAPGGITNPYGCTPGGRVINTIVTLAAGEQTTVNVNLTFNCADATASLGQTYTIMAVADAHSDDAASCPAFQIQTMTCATALADDDNDATDNRLTTTGFRVK